MIALFLLYLFICEIIYFLLSPILFSVFRSKPGSERLAINYPKKQFDIIVHAASVGEINGIKQLLIELLNTHPELSILLTTNTVTGRKAAQNIHLRLEVILSPLDLWHLRVKQISFSKPKLILIAETEIWPALLFIARLRKIPVVFINARISERTFIQYIKFKGILNTIGKSIKTICAQSEADRLRFCGIFKAECIRTGNLKFCVIQPEYDQQILRQENGYSQEDKIIVFGSSRPGEEELILNSYDTLKGEFPSLKLVLAPRHMNRLNEIRTIIGARPVSFFSAHGKAVEIHIIDEMGNLLPFYALCNIAVIGGSFFPFGGHNPLEAAYYGKIILMGPHYQSCAGTVQKLRRANALQISSVENLTADLRKILSDLHSYQDYGLRAQQVLAENQNSLASHLDAINKYL
jgi:3-deoxy-D-manno-octulosonic-acid transferase